MSFSVSTISIFDKQSKRLSKKYPSLKNDLKELAQSLREIPRQGISLGNNFYKVRLSITSKGKGKSGGCRLITYIKVTTSTIYLTSIYDKSEQATISKKELKKVLKLIPD